MILRWIMFGAVLATLVSTFLPTEFFKLYFGPSVMGLGFTLAVTTVMEVCSEGSTPIAADLVTRAGAPGNGFAFLMAGVMLMVQGLIEYLTTRVFDTRLRVTSQRPTAERIIFHTAP